MMLLVSRRTTEESWLETKAVRERAVAVGLSVHSSQAQVEQKEKKWLETHVCLGEHGLDNMDAVMQQYEKDKAIYEFEQLCSNIVARRCCICRERRLRADHSHTVGAGTSNERCRRCTTEKTSQVTPCCFTHPSGRHMRLPHPTC